MNEIIGWYLFRAMVASEGRMDLEAARREMAREAAQPIPNSDASFHGARRVLIAAATEALKIEHPNGLSLGDVLQHAAGAPPTPDRQAFAALVIHALAIEGLIPSPAIRADIDRSICSLAESALPQVLRRYNYPFKGQNYEKRRALEALHANIVALLSPLASPPQDLSGLLHARTRLTKALKDNTVEAYFGAQCVSDLHGAVQRVFETLSDLQIQDDPAIHARLRLAEEAVTNLKAVLGERPGEVAGAVSEFLKAAGSVVSRLVDETAPRLVSDIATARPEPRVAAKRYQLYAEGRELGVLVPLVNRGPGWAYDVEVQAVSGSDAIYVQSDSLHIGDVRPGDFSVALPVLVCTPCREASLLLDVSWRMASSPERQSKTLTVGLEGQRADVDWTDLEGRDPYSITVAEGSRFVGRAARVRSISGRFTRDTMESVLIDGQKRVGKSSLALAVRDAVIAQTGGNTHVIYREFGDYGSADPVDTVAALGRTLAEEMLLILPPSDLVLSLDFKGTLAPLNQLARLLQARCPSLRFLIILDEFDEIHPELYQHGRLADVFFQNLRTFSGQKNVGVMLVGGERLRYILSRQGDQLNRFSRERLSYFGRSTEWEDYAALVQRPSQPDINWDLACANQLHDLTNGHPYFTKLLCREAYRAAVVARDTEITPIEVNAAVASLIAGLDLNHFAHFWMDGILEEPEVVLSVELDRRRLLIAAARALRAGEGINIETIAQHKDGLLDTGKIKPLLDEFVQREILHEDHGKYRFTLPLFEQWLVDAGVTKLMPEQSAHEQAALAKRAEDDAFVTSPEITKVANGWSSYRGQVVGPERIRAWLSQVQSNQDQRILFKLLQTLRFVGEKEIREKLGVAHGMVKQLTSALTPKSRAERRYDLVVTYVDGEGKSGQYYASKYAEENLISTQCVIGQANFASRMQELEKERGRLTGVVVVDDVIGTGQSLRTNLTTFLAANPIIAERKIPVVVVVLLATKEGEQYLREAISSEMGPNIDLRVCEHIDGSVLPFGSESRIWASEIEAERARSLVRILGSRIYKKSPFGFGDTGLLLVFPQTVPNNSLPILHSAAKGPDPWEPLFQRPVN